MDWTQLIGPAATAAVVTGAVNWILTRRKEDTDQKLKMLDANLTKELASQKAELERELAAQRRKFEGELTEQKARLDNRAAFAAERVAHQLLMDPEWRLRSFAIIKHHLRGFDDNDLRQILVRAGGISLNSKSGKELWGLLDRNMDRLGIERLDTEPGFKYLSAAPETTT